MDSLSRSSRSSSSSKAKKTGKRSCSPSQPRPTIDFNIVAADPTLSSMNQKTYDYIRELYWEGYCQSNKLTVAIEVPYPLTFDRLAMLSPNEWLNDQVLNAYVHLLGRSLGSQQICILNTYFSSNIIKSTQEKKKRFLSKNGITPEKTLVVPLNVDCKHWYFAVLSPSEGIRVFDSCIELRDILHSSVYTAEIHIKEFYSWFYNKNYVPVIETRFPQQEGSNDCGVYALWGMRTAVRNRVWERFDSRLVNIVRAILTRELMTQEIGE